MLSRRRNLKYCAGIAVKKSHLNFCDDSSWNRLIRTSSASARRRLEMRGAILALAILPIGASLGTPPAQAQTYDPSYPVCLHVYGRISYYECRYTSLPQCNMSASGRAAQCEINPYYAQSRTPSARKRHRNVY
jgi:hypothetical protein